MKELIIYIYTLLFTVAHAFSQQVRIRKTQVWRLTVKNAKESQLYVENSQIKKSLIQINDFGNVVHICGAKVERCEIRINGRANQLAIHPQCTIHNSVIVINGNNCHIAIGTDTSVNSMYMVCMGQDNHITIGESCMIADNVDIWSSDSHPIFNENNEVCNTSRPIEIGKHVWIGKSAKVLKGAVIHDNAIIGMGAIVTKEVPANTLIVGENGRIVKSNVNWSREFIKI